jgi:ubiquinone/menaquinone biosynthesis C-methylase UbiE
MTFDLASVAEYWDAAAPAFDQEPDHGLLSERTRSAWVRVLGQCVPAEPQDVLDVGCGTGSLSLELARLGHRVTGVDLADAMVVAARGKLAAAGLTAEFLVGDAAEPPTGVRTFDVVLARHLLWTLPSPVDALRAWIRRLRPGGRLVLVEGRWATVGQTDAPYVPGAERLPWGGGVGAEDLADVLGPLVAEVQLTDLAVDADLWGRPVDDERYALVARI